MGLATVERVKYPHIRAAERDRHLEIALLRSNQLDQFLAENTIYSYFAEMPDLLPLWLRRQLEAALDGDNHGIDHEKSDDPNFYHTMGIPLSKSNEQVRKAAKKRRKKRDESFWDMMRAYMDSFEATLKSMMDLRVRIETVERKIDLKIAALGPAAALAGDVFDEIKSTVSAIKQELTSTADAVMNGGRLPSPDTLKSFNTRIEENVTQIEAAAEAAKKNRSILDSIKAWRNHGAAEEAQANEQPQSGFDNEPSWKRAFETAAEEAAGAYYSAGGRSPFGDFAYNDASYGYTANDEQPKSAQKPSGKNTYGQKAKPGAQASGSDTSGENSNTHSPKDEYEQAANTAGPAPGEETL